MTGVSFLMNKKYRKRYKKMLTIYRKRYIIINVRRTNKEKVQSTGKEKRQWVRSERKRKSLYSGKT